MTWLLGRDHFGGVNASAGVHARARYLRDPPCVG
jgi:hypothetical protein